MKILFIGDSITNGKLGESFVDVIKAKKTDYHIENLGRDGETFHLIMQRLIECLKNDNTFDLIILQGGYNDLLLPTFQKKGMLFRFAYRQQLKKGNIVLSNDTNAAFAMLRQAIKETRQLFSGKIILVSLGCLGENMDSALNQRRKWLNNIFEDLAVTEKITVTNTRHMVDTYLKNKATANYCLNSFWAVTVFDRYTTFFSAKRKLHLTIDGVHLNKTGAEIFATSVLNAIENQQ